MFIIDKFHTTTSDAPPTETFACLPACLPVFLLFACLFVYKRFQLSFWLYTCIYISAVGPPSQHSLITINQYLPISPTNHTWFLYQRFINSTPEIKCHGEIRLVWESNQQTWSLSLSLSLSLLSLSLIKR